MLSIINGRVIDPASGRDEISNVFIKDGVIVEVSDRSPQDGCDIVDATGLCVLPGFVDIHTHLREPGFEHKEDIESGSRAAIAGGFTTILCMPNTKPTCDNIAVTRQIVERANSIDLINILPVGAMSRGLKGQELADIDGMVEQGVIAISDDGGCIQDDAIMRRAMIKAKELDIVAISHPEDHTISAGGIINDGLVSKELGVKGIPREAENGMIRRDIDLCRETLAKLHITHISTAEGIEMVRQAKAEGLSITCEVTPHHLLLTEGEISELGANGKMNPPLRTEKDRQALIAALSDGTVNAIATDHAPHAIDEKIDIDSSPFGIIGMESAFPACMQLVEQGLLSFARLIWLLTKGPADAMGIDAGTLSVGMPADITIINPEAEYSFTADDIHSKSQNCPFIGRRVIGRIDKCFRRGIALS
jgi:dihydroorotase